MTSLGASRPQHQLERRPEGQPQIVLTEREAAERCRYFDRGCADPVRAFQKWARRVGMPVKRAGRARLYDPRILDAFMERAPWTYRHKPVAKKPLALSLVPSTHASESDGKPQNSEVEGSSL